MPKVLLGTLELRRRRVLLLLEPLGALVAAPQPSLHVVVRVDAEQTQPDDCG